MLEVEDRFMIKNLHSQGMSISDIARKRVTTAKPCAKPWPSRFYVSGHQAKRSAINSGRTSSTLRNA